MKCNWLRWFWGLLPLGLLIAFTYANTHERIQSDLKSRTEAALQATGLKWANTGFDGRDGHIAGRAVAPEQQSKAREVVRDVWGVRVADDRTALVERAAEYVWSAARRGERVELTGFVPDRAVRRSIIRVAARSFPDARIIDRMKPARGAPEHNVWMNGVNFGLTQLARLQSGSQVGLRNAEFEIEGRALSVDAYSTVRGALSQGLPSGLRLAQAKIVPPVVSPYPWSAEFSGSRIQLDGHAPDEDARDNVLAASKRLFPRAAIVDRMSVAGGAPIAFVSSVSAVLRELSKLKSGRVALRDTALVFRGVAVKEETADAVIAGLRRALPAGYSLEHDVEFDQPTIPLAQPYRTSVDVMERRVRLNGYVPSQAARQSLVETVAEAFPARRVIEDLQIARGQPDGWRTCMTAAIGGLGKLGSGRAVMRDDALRVVSKTDDEALASALPGDLRAATNRSCRFISEIALELPPEPQLDWRIEHDGKTVALSGEVPDSGTRTTLLERARKAFPSAEVVDEMRIKPSRGTRWRTVALVALESVSRLRVGTASIDGQTLTVSGQARDTAAVTGVRQRLKTIPKMYQSRDNLEIKSDAMLWAEQEARRQAEAEKRRREEASARRQAEAEKRRREEEAARRQAEAEKRRREEEEAARRQAEAEKRRREEAAARRRAEVETRRREEAAARRQAEADKRRREEEEAARRQAEADKRRREEAALRRARVARDQCQTALDQTRKSGTINFATASANIERSSFALLDQLAEATRACDGVLIDIEGHTDAQGSEDANLKLSQRRAESVVDYLVRAGVSRDRLIARGYGESQPVVPNTTLANMARNRRIEFVVRVR